MPYKNHISSFESLITPHKETRAGFIALALEKSKKAAPFVEEAKTLKALALKAEQPEDLLSMPDIQNSLLAASGISDKAKARLKDQDKRAAIINLIENIL